MKVICYVVAREHWIHKSVVKTLLNMQKDDRHEVEIAFMHGSPVDHVRNNCVDHFLESDADYMLMTDDDTGCPRNPLDLIDHKVDIIGLLTPLITKDGLRMNVSTKEKLPQSGMIEVEQISTSCLLLSRKAVETIPRPLFNSEIKKGKRVRGQDIMFCERARVMGFKIYCDTGYRCDHFFEINAWDMLPRK